MKLTKDQERFIKDTPGWENMFPELVELKTNVWYKNKSVDADVLVYRTSNSNNYGWYNGKWYDTALNCQDTRCWREATEIEIQQAFEKELIKRFGNEYKYAKVNYSGINSKFSKKRINIGDMSPVITDCEVWSTNGLLYKNGVWAEPLESTFDEDFQKLFKDVEHFNKKYKNGIMSLSYTKSMDTVFLPYECLNWKR